MRMRPGMTTIPGNGNPGARRAGTRFAPRQSDNCTAMHEDELAHARRRRWLVAVAAGLVGARLPATAQERRGAPAMTLYTFGDSILDCGGYNPNGIDPGQLLVRNDDA